MTDLDRLAELGRPVEKTQMWVASFGDIIVRDAALAERMASEVELLEENARLRTRIEHLTVDCDAHEYNLDDGRCYHAESGRMCPREPRCHDEDRRHQKETSDAPD